MDKEVKDLDAITVTERHMDLIGSALDRSGFNEASIQESINFINCFNDLAYQLEDDKLIALFEQGNIQSGGEFAELRAYLLAKLVNNTEIGLEKEMAGFLLAFYGQAAGHIKEYIHLLHDHNQGFTGRKLSIFGSPLRETDTYLSPDLLKAYNGIFDKAERAVKNSPDHLERIKSARLPVTYATLEIEKENDGNNWNFLETGGKRRLPGPVSDFLYSFVYHCIRSNVSRLSEWRTTPMEYLEKYPIVGSNE